MIKDLFDLNDYNEFKKEVHSLINSKDDFHPVIYKIIRKSIFPRYKSFIHHLKDKRIEKQVTKLKMPFKNNAKIQKTNIQDQTRRFKTNISQRSNLE